MDIISFSIYSCIALFATIFGIIFIAYGSNSKKAKKDKRLLPLVIVGWTMVALSIVAVIFCFILYVDEAGGEYGTYLLIFISPLFILGGFAACIAIGASLLANAYKLPKEDVTRKQSIVRGWFLLILAIVVVVVIIVTFMVLLNNYESTRERPIRMM